MNIDVVWHVLCTAGPVGKSFKELGPYMSVSAQGLERSPLSEKQTSVRGPIWIVHLCDKVKQGLQQNLELKVVVLFCFVFKGKGIKNRSQ